MRVEAREVPCSFLVALGSGALEPVSGFAEVDFRAGSFVVPEAKVALRIGIALIRRERVVPERFFKFILRNEVKALNCIARPRCPDPQPRDTASSPSYCPA